MTFEQFLILAILVCTMGLFLWERLRHDMVALLALLVCVIAGLVPMAGAFAGFGHPAVITVAGVLVLSRGLQNWGALDVLVSRLLPQKAGRVASISALVLLGAVLSGFMNNVGAMALLMPVAVQVAGRLGLTPGQVLMPLAFATILGGMTTLIGTPPNLIVSGFRDEAGLGAFQMFDFTPVGLSVALAGVAFVALVGWRFVPAKQASGGDAFETGAYLTEARVTEKSKVVGISLRQLETELEESGAQIVGLVRNEVRMNAPPGARVIRADDILVLEAEVGGLAEMLSKLGLKLEEQGSLSPDDAGQKDDKDSVRAETEDIVLQEFVVRPESAIVDRSAKEMLLRTRYGLNLLAVARDGRQSKARLRTLKLKSGDLILMQGPSDVLADFAAESGCVPLAARELRIPDKKMAIISATIIVAAMLLAAFSVLPAPVSFTLGVVASVVFRTVPVRTLYTSIDWPVIVLLAAMIPVAGAMQTTGTAALMARFLVEIAAQGNAVLALGLILIVTMFLSDMMNNAATAAVMSPIALGVAAALGVNADSFLMAVAIGASCSFLTPIGHQNNTLILGPGGFSFRDYWRLGLPLEALVAAVAIPLLLIVWPL